MDNKEMNEWTNKCFKERQRNEGKQHLNEHMNEKQMKKQTSKGDWQTNLPSPSVSTNSFIAFAKIQKELL